MVLYWFVNNLFSIGQQFIVNTQFKNAKDAQIAVHKHAQREEKKKLENDTDKKEVEKKDD